MQILLANNEKREMNATQESSKILPDNSTVKSRWENICPGCIAKNGVGECCIDLSMLQQRVELFFALWLWL